MQYYTDLLWRGWWCIHTRCTAPRRSLCPAEWWGGSEHQQLQWHACFRLEREGSRRDSNELKDSRACGVRWWVTPSTTLRRVFHFQFQPNLNALPNTVVVSIKFTYYPVYFHSTYRSACLRPCNILGYLRRLLIGHNTVRDMHIWRPNERSTVH